jgi:hypothetical protein
VPSGGGVGEGGGDGGVVEVEPVGDPYHLSADVVGREVGEGERDAVEGGEPVLEVVEQVLPAVELGVDVEVGQRPGRRPREMGA